MNAILQLATLSLATLFALAAAIAFDWLLLRFAFSLMRPAKIRSSTLQRRPLLVGSLRVARALSVRSQAQ